MGCSTPTSPSACCRSRSPSACCTSTSSSACCTSLPCSCLHPGFPTPTPTPWHSGCYAPDTSRVSWRSHEVQQRRRGCESCASRWTMVWPQCAGRGVNTWFTIDKPECMKHKGERLGGRILEDLDQLISNYLNAESSDT